MLYKVLFECPVKDMHLLFPFFVHSCFFLELVHGLQLIAKCVHVVLLQRHPQVCL